ncbi:DUF4215 domain-containing protein [Patescibacteria group bacterium]|nr:MAG: DUF4215 domain-containing protein [Patescibacteria group bacterium]
MLSSKKPKSYIFTGGILISLIFNFALLTFNFAFAQGLDLPSVASLPDRPLPDLLVGIINGFLGLLGVIALGVLIYGGFVWMTSGGIPQRIALAKRILLSAAVGFFFVLISWAVVNFVINGAAGGGGGGPGPGPGPGPLPGPVSCMSWKFVDPRDGETGVPLCAPIQAETLNENLESEATITTGPGGDIQVQQFCTADNQCPLGLGGVCAGMFCQNHLPGSVQVKNRTLTFYPSQLLTAGAVYLVSLTSGITNASASRTACPKTWQFTAGTDVDTTPPTVLQVSPKDNNTDVCLAKSIKVQFSEPMDLISMQDVLTADTADNAPLVCQEGANKGAACAVDADCYFACDPTGLFCKGGINEGQTCALASEQTVCPATVAACYADNLAALEISPLDTQDAVNDLSFNATVLASDRISYSHSKNYKENTTYNPILRADVLKDRCGNPLDGELAPDGVAEGTTTDDYATGTESLPDQVGNVWSFRTGNNPICTPVIDNIAPNNGFYDEIGGDNSDEIIITGNNFDDIAANIVFNQNTIASTGGIQGCFDKGAPAYTKTTDACVDPATDWVDNLIKTRIPASGGSSNGAISGGVYVLVDNFDCVGAPAVCVGGTRSGESCDGAVNINGPTDPQFNTLGCPGGASNAVNLDVLSPRLKAISPSNGGPGSWITIYANTANPANGFGAAAGSADLIDSAGNRIPLSFPCALGWSDGYIIAEIPLGTAAGSYAVQVTRADNRHSNLGSFTVDASPIGPGICALSLSCGEINTAFDISGKRFGAAVDQVVFKKGAVETPADLTSTVWTDTNITGIKVPAGLPDDNYEVIVKVAGTPSNGIGFNKPCAGTPCDSDTVAPLCQPDPAICSALGPTYSCNPGTCMCDNNPLPKVVQQNSCTFGTQSPSPYRDQIDSCLNAVIGVRFDKDMEDATVVKANIQVDICGNDDCLIITSSNIDKTLWGYLFGAWDGVKEGFALQPNPDLLPNTAYRVTLKETMTSAISLGGYHLDGNSNGVPDGPGPGPLKDDYSWIFKTSNDSCKVKSISTSPVNMSVAVSGSKPISASPQAENCNILNASDYNWEWTEADNTIATVTKTVAPNQSVLGVKAGATTVSAKITNPAEASISAGTSNITVTNNLFCSDAGLAAVWKFDEQDGDIALDSSISGANDGALANNPTRLSTGCKFGKCLAFNGTNTYVNAGASMSLAMTDAFTVQAWIYPKGSGSCTGPTGGGGIIINKEGEYEIARFVDGSVRFAIANTNPSWVFVNTGYIVPLNTWTHLDWVYSDSDNFIKMYANGNEVYSGFGDGIIGDSHPGDDDFRIGSRQAVVCDGTNQYFDGVIDEVRIWNKALGISEIKSIYNQACLPIAVISCSDPNLKAVWKLDENSGIVANDSSSNNNDGQLNYSPTWVAAGCKFGGCLSFDGNNDFIEVPSNPVFNFGDGTNDRPFTFEAWVKRSDLVKSGVIFSKYYTYLTNTRSQYWLRINAGGKLNIGLTDAPIDARILTETTNPAIIDTNWHHVAATYDGSSSNVGLKIYVDGLEQAVTPSSVGSYVAMESTTANFQIGRYTDSLNNGENLFGSIDEPRIWDKALTQEEIISAMSQACLAGGVGVAICGNSIIEGAEQCDDGNVINGDGCSAICKWEQIYCTDPSLTAVWKMDEGIGVVAGDSTANNLDGALKNGLNNTGWKSGADCQFTDGRCLEFDGADDYVEISNSPLLSFSSPFTIEGWINLAQYTGSAAMIFDKYDGAGVKGLELYVRTVGPCANKFEGSPNNNDYCDSVSGTNIDLNAWYHIAQTYNGANFRIYVNGVEQGSGLPFTGNISNNQSLRFGSDANGNSKFKGKMDEMHIWNKALTDNQIQSIYNSGTGRQCLAPQKGSACDLDLTAPMCQPNAGLCESGDPTLRCSITSCTCQPAFAVVPPPTFTVDSGGSLACRNTAITVNFNNPIGASTIKTATTTVKPKSPPILSENFDAGLPAGWVTTQTGGTGMLTWQGINGQLVEGSDNNAGWFASPNALPSTTNFRISFDTGALGPGDNAIGIAWNYKDENNYYRLIWEDPTDWYAGIYLTRLVLQKRVDGNLVENASVTDSGLVGRGLVETSGPIAQVGQSAHFYIDVVGTKITVSNDAGTLLSYNDSQAPSILPGKIAFYTLDNDGGIFYDNLVVTEYEATNIPGTVELYALQSATGNLLADGDMEKSDTILWQQYATPKVIEKSTAEKKSGKQSLHVITDTPDCVPCGSHEGVVTNIGVVNPGDRVRVKGWAKIMSGNFIAAIATNTSGSWMASNPNAPFGPGNWREFTVDLNWPTTSSSGPLVMWFAEGAAPDSEFYIDDVSVTIEHNLAVDISARVSGSQLTISPKQFLDTNRNYILNLHGAIAANIDPDGPYTYDPANVIRSINGTPLETVNGIYDWNFNTGTEICKIGKAEIVFTKNPPASAVSYKSPDLFVCAGDSCQDDVDGVTSGNNHLATAIPYAVNGGILAGPMIFAWTPSTDAPFSVGNSNPVDPTKQNQFITPKPMNGQGTLAAQVDQLDASLNVIGTAKASANITVALCENPWPAVPADWSIFPFQDVPAATSTNFSLWYCRDSGNMQDLTDDLPDLTVQEVTNFPGNPKPIKEYLYYDAGNVNDALGIRVYANQNGLPLSEWLSQNANVNGGQSGVFNGWESVKAGRSLYVSAANDVGSGIYMNVYLISYSDKAGSTMIGIYNQMISNWKFMSNGITDQDIAKLQRDLKRVADMKTIATALDNYKTKNGSYPKLDAGTYLPGMSTSVWPSWQASFGNALQTSIPKDPINSLGNLMAWWKFDEGKGIAAKDSSLNGNDGQFINNPVLKSGSDCKSGGCLALDGSDDYVKLPDIFSATPGAITVEGWFKTTTTAQSMFFSINSYSMYINRSGQPAGSLLPFFDNNSTGDPGWGNYNDGQWHHFAATNDGSKTSLYTDGGFINSRPENFSSSLSGAAIGVIYDASANWYKGSIDELRAYNRALSGSEIALLAANGNADATGWNQDSNSFRCDAGADFDSHIYQYLYNNANSYNLYASMEYVGPTTGNTYRQTDIASPFPQPTVSYSCYNYKLP